MNILGRRTQLEVILSVLLLATLLALTACLFVLGVTFSSGKHTHTHCLHISYPVFFSLRLPLFLSFLILHVLFSLVPLKLPPPHLYDGDSSPSSLISSIHFSICPSPPHRPPVWLTRTGGSSLFNTHSCLRPLSRDAAQTAVVTCVCRRPASLWPVRSWRPWTAAQTPVRTSTSLPAVDGWGRTHFLMDTHIGPHSTTSWSRTRLSSNTCWVRRVETKWWRQMNGETEAWLLFSYCPLREWYV